MISSTLFFSFSSLQINNRSQLRRVFYNIMSFLICEKHNKCEKVGSKVAVNGYICMNRYCPESFRVFCGACKNDHRDHSIKVLTIEDVSFLVERLLKTPFREVGRVTGETLDIMKKLKLIKEFRKKIDILEKEVQREALKLIEQTEALIQEYSISQESVEKLSQLFAGLEEPDAYKQFTESSASLLSNLDYNFKKDKFELGSGLIREKEDKRRKSVERAKRKIEEVRDYSMKIIQVILHNDDSEEEQSDNAYQKKHYQVLKAELTVEKNEKELQDEISELKNSSTINRSRMRREAIDQLAQTQAEVVTRKESEAIANTYIQQLKETFAREHQQLKQQIQVLQAENKKIEQRNLKAKEDLQKERQNNTLTRKTLTEIENKMRRIKSSRMEKEQMREQIVGRIIEFSQAKTVNSDDKQ